jgi:hypothetical protein
MARVGPYKLVGIFSRNESAFHPVLQIDSQTTKLIDEAFTYSGSKMNNKIQEKPKLAIATSETEEKRAPRQGHLRG